MKTENITTPPLHVLDGIRKLKGDAKVTYPTPSRRLKKIERVVSVARKDADLPYGTRDGEHKTARLAYQVITGGDAQNVEVYRVYLTKAAPEQQTEWGYQVSYPTADPAYPRVTWTFRIEDKDYTALADGAACPIDGFSTLVIIEQQFQPSTDGAYFGTETRIYERIPGAPMTTVVTDQSGLEVTVLSQVVDPSTAPMDGHLVQEDAIASINTRQAQRGLRVIDSFPPQPGQMYDESLDVAIPFTDQTVARAASMSAGVVEATPIDYARRRDRTFTVPHAALQAFVRRFCTFINLNLPAELTKIEVRWAPGGGAGAYEEIGSGSASGSSANLALSPRGSANSSGSVSPEIIPTIKQKTANPIEAEDIVFYTTDPSVGSILGRLMEILDEDEISIWPSFQTETYRFLLTGQKVAVSANTSVSNSVSISSSNYSSAVSQGHGVDGDEATSLRTVDIGPVINDDLDLEGDLTQSRDAEATSATILASGTNFPGGSAAAIAQATAEGSVFPVSIPATSPSSIPTSGRYLYDARCEVYKWGYSIVRATVLNAAYIVRS